MARVTSRRSASLRRSVIGAALFILLAPTAVFATEEPVPPPALPVDDTVPTGEPAAAHAETHVLVKTDVVATVEELGGVSEEVVEDWYEVEVPPGVEAADYAEDLQDRVGVEAAEVDAILESQAAPPFNSTDPLYTVTGSPMFQWHLHAANVVSAWQTTVGAGAIVAILDTGVNDGSDGFCHPFVAEYNAEADLAGTGTAFDADGHGSHVAGSVAQCSDNEVGGAGMAPEASIMPIKVFPASGGALASDIARGIDWAVANGARVINMSVGCPVSTCSTGTSPMNEAIARASAAGVVMVSSSGNNPIDVYYPANHPEVLGVGATTRSGSVASYSARGIGLDLVAPGGDTSGSGLVWQDTSGGYDGKAGTSMASAHVSGAAALLVSRFPTAPPTRVRNALTCSAVDIGPEGWDGPSGFGRLDAGAAVEQLRLMTEAGTSNCVNQGGDNATYGSVQSTTGFWRLHKGPAQVAGFYYGNPGDIGFMGDWDCDGIETPGLYRQSDGYAYLRNSNTQGVADVSFFFGNPGDVPLAGDFDGDGCDTLSLFRASEGRFYIINRLGSGDRGLGRAQHAYYFGNPGDAPFMGDWNGDGTDTPGLRRNSNGFVYLRHSNSQGVAEVEYFYGDPGDVVFTGDWDKDGDDTLGLYRPSTGIVFLRNSNSTGIADHSFGVGAGLHAVGGEF